jgi:hypothetical protein
VGRGENISCALLIIHVLIARGFIGQWADFGETHVVAVEVGAEAFAAVWAFVVGGVDGAIAGVAAAEEVGEAGDALSDIPELSGGGSAHDGVAGDPTGFDELDDGFVAEARLVWAIGIAEKPWSHGVMGGPSAEGIEMAAAGSAFRGVGLGFPAVGADEDLRLRHGHFRGGRVRV